MLVWDLYINVLNIKTVMQSHCCGSCVMKTPQKPGVNPHISTFFIYEIVQVHYSLHVAWVRTVISEKACI